MEQQKKPKTHFLKQELKDRGWTKGLIDKYLVEPDTVRRRPGGGLYHLFKIERVISVENLDDFKNYQNRTIEKRKKASIRLKTLAEEKRKKLIDYVSNIKIKIKYFEDKEALFKAACRHYNNLWESRGDYEKNASTDADETFLKRISINMLRHQSDSYEYTLDKLFGEIGRTEGYEILKRRVNNAIFEKYPFLIGDNENEEY